MKFTKIPENTFQEIQLNAGVLLSAFDVTNPPAPDAMIANIIGATSGGVNFTATPSFEDYGEDIDNCPKNMLELKKLESWEIKMSGTYVTINANQIKSMIGAADVSEGKITPRNDITPDDFSDLWWVGDYSDKNGDANGGFIAIHMLNSLSTGGFQIKSGDKTKGQFAFEYTAHYSMADQDKVPFEAYIKAGSEEAEAVSLSDDAADEPEDTTITEEPAVEQPGEMEDATNETV